MPSRSELSSAMKALPIWTEVSRAYRSAVPKASKGGDFAKCLKDLMDRGAAGRDAYRKCAEQTGLSAKLSAEWSD